jgi:hypothetical protein
MGAAAVIRHAGLVKSGTLCHGHRLRHPPDAVASVSAPSRWFVRDTRPMWRIHWFAERGTGWWHVECYGFASIPALSCQFLLLRLTSSDRLRRRHC